MKNYGSHEKLRFTWKVTVHVKSCDSHEKLRFTWHVTSPTTDLPEVHLSEVVILPLATFVRTVPNIGLVNLILCLGRSGDVTMMLQAAIETTCHDHSTTAWVGRCYIRLRYLVFVFVVRFLFIRWFPCIRNSIIFWGFPHVMVRVPLHWKRKSWILRGFRNGKTQRSVGFVLHKF